MTDKIQKIISKLSSKEREVVKLLIMRIKMDDLGGLDIKRLKGHQDLFRVRKGQIRVVYQKNASVFMVVRIDRRNEKTYKGL